MAWFENYASGLTGTPNITVGTVTATTGTFTSQGASTSVSVTQTTNPGNAYVSIQAAGANQYSYTQLGGGQYTWVNTNASNQINWGTTLGTAKAYMDCAAGALTLTAGLTATTGAFSGAVQLTQTTGTASPSAGGAGALPATPAGYMTISINGTNRQIAFY